MTISRRTVLGTGLVLAAKPWRAVPNAAAAPAAAQPAVARASSIVVPNGSVLPSTIRDGVRIFQPTVLPVGGMLQVGRQTFKHEWLTGTQLHYQITKIAMEANRSVRIRTEVSGYDAMCLLINAGMGIGILPHKSASIYQIPNTRVIELDEEWSQREILIGVRRRSDLQPSAESLLSFMLESGAYESRP